MTGSRTSIEDVVARSDSVPNDFLRGWAELLSSETPFESESMPKARHLVKEYLLRADDFRRFVKEAMEWFQRRSSLTGGERRSDPSLDDDERAWRSLVRDIAMEIGSQTNLDAFVQQLDLRSREPPKDPLAVVLMTIHSANGMEFDDVYLVGLAEGILPSFQSLQRGDKSPEMEEERRNCFVAITRAMRSLRLTYADEYQGYSKLPSRFLYEMGMLKN